MHSKHRIRSIVPSSRFFFALHTLEPQTPTRLILRRVLEILTTNSADTAAAASSVVQPQISGSSSLARLFASPAGTQRTRPPPLPAAVSGGTVSLLLRDGCGVIAVVPPRYTLAILSQGHALLRGHY